MKFLVPMAFYFAAALPVVVVFYLLKRKRVIKLISSTLLWEKFLSETQASAPFQRLRHNWLLILQLLLLLLVIFAVARPYLAGKTKSSRLNVLILDASASMQSTDVKPSRFEKARQQALEWVDGLHDFDQMVVLLAGANTQVKQSATSDKVALRRALASCRVADSPTRLVEAFKLAETLTRDRSDAEIHLFSDGALPNLSDFQNKNLPLAYHRVGERANNIGIVSVDVRANPEDARQRAVFASVANFFQEPVKTELELSFNNTVVEVRPLTIPATNSVPVVFLAPQTNDGVFSLRLTLQDDLASDNRASVVSLMPRPAKALLVSRGNRFLEKALRGPGNIELATAGALTDNGAGYDFVVLDDVAPAVWPKVNTLAIHIVNTNLFPTWETIKTPGIVDWKGNHPLLRSVGFDDVPISESYRVSAPGWGVPIVESPQGPLIIAGERDHHRLIWIGFDLLQSMWPFRVSFPIFMANAIEWLNPSNANASQAMVRAGDPLRLALTEEISVAELTKPDGSKHSIPVPSAEHELVFGETDQQGVYTLQAGTNKVMFCVNLVDAAESNTQPRDELPFGKYGKVTATTLKRANVELWRWIAAGGLLVLLFEWWYYHRRTA